MKNKNHLGMIGEKLAAAFLKEKGYQLIAQNWRSGRQELDLLFLKDQFLVVVEVKTRSSRNFGSPADSVNFKKQQNIQKATQAFLIQNKLIKEVRFDIVSVIMGKTRPRIEHIEGAFFPFITY